MGEAMSTRKGLAGDTHPAAPQAARRQREELPWSMQAGIYTSPCGACLRHAQLADQDALRRLLQWLQQAAERNVAGAKQAGVSVLRAHCSASRQYICAAEQGHGSDAAFLTRRPAQA